MLVGLLIAPAIPAHAYHRERQSELETLIDKNEAKISAAKKSEKSLLAQIADSDRRRELLETQVRAASAELERAQAELDLVTRRLAALDAKVDAKTTELEVLLGRLYEQETRMNARVASFYMNAPSHMAAGSGSYEVGDLIDIQGFALSVMESDRRVATKLATAKEAVDDRRREIQQAQEEVASQHAKKEAETQKLANAKASKDRAMSEVNRELGLKSRLLGSVKARRAEYERILASYEKENAEIEAFLKSQGSSGGAIRGRGGWLVWPVSGPITSQYGWRTHPIYKTRAFHTGIDIGAQSGVPIDAARSGKVISAGYKGAYGLAAMVDHGEGIVTLYAHMSSIRVSVGQTVRTGDTVGLVGSTGYSTGPHLHFEVRVNGSHTDPNRWL